MCITFLCHNVYFYMTIYNKIHVNMYMSSVYNIFCASYNIYTVFRKYNEKHLFYLNINKLSKIHTKSCITHIFKFSFERGVDNSLIGCRVCMSSIVLHVL